MTTFREIVSMVLDRGKLIGDDTFVEPEHVLFLASRLRSYLLTSKYKQAKSQVSASNMQTLTLCLEPADSGCGCDTEGMYMARSVKAVPELLLLNNFEGATSVTAPGTFGCMSHINMVSAARFATVGVSKWQKLQSYASIGPDKRLYIKSADSGIQDMEAVQITAVFENAEKAAQAEAESLNNGCGDDSTPCDVMDMEFPLEEGLITLLIENISQVVYDMSMKPQDVKNSANDELGTLAGYINSMLKDRYRRNDQSADNA